MSRPPFDALILCATPRSGSTLLCSLLESSQVAGRPASWYRAEDRRDYAAAWGLPRDAAGRWSPSDYLATTIAAGRSPNGVFGLRVMRSTLPELLAELSTLHPEAITGGEIMVRAFGRCRYVHLRRADTLAQAVSRLKAEQTGLWHRIGSWEDRVADRDGPPHYDDAAIAEFRADAEADDAAWTAWFEANDLQPAMVLYEDLAKDPVGTASTLLTALGLAASETLSFENARLADAESQRWIDRFRAGALNRS